MQDLLAGISASLEVMRKVASATFHGNQGQRQQQGNRTNVPPNQDVQGANQGPRASHDIYDHKNAIADAQGKNQPRQGVHNQQETDGEKQPPIDPDSYDRSGAKGPGEGSHNK